MDTKEFRKSASWTPNADSGRHTRKLKSIIEKKYKTHFNDYWELHRWSVENIPEFWEEMWNYTGIIYSQPYYKVVDRNATCEDMPKWFEGARLNYAQNLLRYRDDRVALILAGEERQTEKITFSGLYEKVCEYGAALRKCGVRKGDNIVCYMSNREEPVCAMLAATSIGAIWSGALPLLGAKAVLNRFKLTKPKILLTMDRFVHNGEEKEMLTKVEEIVHGLPSLEKVIIVPTRQSTAQKDFPFIRNSCLLAEFLALGRNDDGSLPELEFEQLPFDHPVFISYTSGTTGPPKTLIQGIGMLLITARDFWVHNDATRDDVFLSMSPVGWLSWNICASLLHFGVTVILFEGVPYFVNQTYLWDLVDEHKISHLTLSSNVLIEVEKRRILPTPKNHLSSLKCVLATGSVVKPHSYDFVYRMIKPDMMFGALYGCTEIFGMCIVFDHTLPVYRGELNAPSLGADICCYDESGNPVIGEVGELIIKRPMPSLPLGLWGDEDGKKCKETYFKKFKGVFAPGDICLINPLTKGIIIYGRSDETLKPKGARFGSSEIYNVVELFEDIRDSLCVSQYSSDGDERAVLFVKMKAGRKYNEELVKKLRKSIENELSKRHVPEVITEVQDIPYNLNGKKMEILVKHIINGKSHNSDMVANPECLDFYKSVSELAGF